MCLVCDAGCVVHVLHFISWLDTYRHTCRARAIHTTRGRSTVPHIDTGAAANTFLAYWNWKYYRNHFSTNLSFVRVTVHVWSFRRLCFSLFYNFNFSWIFIFVFRVVLYYFSVYTTEPSKFHVIFPYIFYVVFWIWYLNSVCVPCIIIQLNLIIIIIVAVVVVDCRCHSRSQRAISRPKRFLLLCDAIFFIWVLFVCRWAPNWSQHLLYSSPIFKWVDVLFQFGARFDVNTL